MKIRTGFVSNSSSSSFICVVCNEDASGWDLSLADADMFVCVNGHTCCNSHKIGGDKSPTTKQMRDKLIKLAEDDTNEIARINDMDEDDVECEYVDADDGEVDECICPICQFKNLSDEDALKYLQKKFNISEKEILTEVRTNYKNYDAFSKFINSKKKS